MQDIIESIRTTGRRVWEGGNIIGITARHNGFYLAIARPFDENLCEVFDRRKDARDWVKARTKH